MPPVDGTSLARLRDIARRAMRERGLFPDFSNAALGETAALSGPASAAGTAVVDFRDRLWASIDNDDSRDLDQLSVAEPLGGDTVRVWVAIADVDAVVARESALDEHAAHNTTSVYTIAQIFPMLPEKLSTDLTSLGQDQDRLALVVSMTVDGGGTVTASEICRGVVRNRAKLTYNGVAAWLDGRGAVPAAVDAVPGMAEQLKIQDRAAAALKLARHNRGALTLETIETRAVFNDGKLNDLRPDAVNRAKELIEDFMIAVNGVVARYLAERRMPVLRRVLRSPERWSRIVALAAGFGDQLPETPDAAQLNGFLLKRRTADPLRFPDLSLAIVKLLGRGEYVLQRPGEEVTGHFGLAIDDYTHSTAPNRRFPDLITQRLIKSALDRSACPYQEEELEALAGHCSAQEEAAAKVERLVGKSAAAMMLAGRIGERFDALVTGAAAKGTWVRLSAPAVEGRVISGFAGMDVGERVRVELVHTDIEHGFIDFAGVR